MYGWVARPTQILNFLSGDTHARRPLHKLNSVFFFFVLSVSCWNIRFGAISNVQPTNSASFRENLRPYSLISPPLNLRDDILFIFGAISTILDSRDISVSLCSARKLIKHSKPNAVRERRNAFMKTFPDFVEIYPICQPSAVLPHMSLISLSIGSYLGLAIFREDLSSVGRVNVQF